MLFERRPNLKPELADTAGKILQQEKEFAIKFAQSLSFEQRLAFMNMFDTDPLQALSILAIHAPEIGFPAPPSMLFFYYTNLGLQGM